MSRRWAIHIDIEGFGQQWNDTIEAFKGLNALMRGIYLIGTHPYSEPPDRLFAHQFGDGFLIVSDFHEDRLDRAALVSIALLRHVLANGATAKAAIAEGDLSDIQGCYPEEIREQLGNGNGHVSCGAGLMTIFPVMGTALISAVGIDKKSPSGPVLALHKSNKGRIPESLQVSPALQDIVLINWLRGDSSDLTELQKTAGFEIFSESQRIDQLNRYMAVNSDLTEAWKKSARDLIG